VGCASVFVAAVVPVLTGAERSASVALLGVVIVTAAARADDSCRLAMLTGS